MAVYLTVPIQGYLISKPLDIECCSALFSAEIRVEESRPFIANLPVRQIK